MKKIILFLLIICISIPAQQQAPKQITDYDYDSKNPVFIPTAESDQGICFEGWTDTSSNIFLLTYDSNLDTFRNLTALTNNNFINRNAISEFFQADYGNYYGIILFETNQNGNWDIAVSVDSGSGWSAPEIIIGSEEDESQPDFIFYNYSWVLDGLVFTRGRSIYSLTMDTLRAEEILLEGNDSVSFANPEYLKHRHTMYIFAERRLNGGDPYLVYIKKYKNDTSWSEIIYLLDSPAVNPRFIKANIENAVTFEVLSPQKRKAAWVKIEEMQAGGDYILYELMDDPSLETSNFSTFSYIIIIPLKYPEDFTSAYPYSWRYVKNDSAFIRGSLMGPYQDNYTKVFNANSATGAAGYSGSGFDPTIAYTLWEDSAGGRINLFGLRQSRTTINVKDKNIPNDFVLRQNYPNPFNPVTKIKFITRKRSFIKLSVYDLLGREAARLVDEEKPAGEYEVQFNAAGLPSGIYFYKLQTENFSSVKKMVLLR